MLHDLTVWATPPIIVMKSNGRVRMCGDFSVTINPHVINADYPLPRFEDLAAKLRIYSWK